MAQSKRVPLKKAKPTPTSEQQHEVEYAPTEVSNIGENGAPGTPDHLMPSVQANGGGVTTDDPKERDLGPDLSEVELADAGYPDPEVTPLEGMKSTRISDETSEEVAKRKVDMNHQFLDDKLHEIGQQQAARRQLEEMSDSDDVDYASLPNAPKGDNVLILGPDEPLRVSGEEQGNVIVLDKAVYRAKRPFRSLRWTFTLEHQIGTHVPVSRVRSVPVPVSKDPVAEETKDETSDPKKNKTEDEN